MRFPESFTQGDSISWNDFPTKDSMGRPIDQTWELKYFIRNEGSTEALVITSVPQDTGWKTTISSEETKSLEAGFNFWQAKARKDNEVITVGTGRVHVKQDFETNDGSYDTRSQTEKDLDSVQKAIRAIVDGNVQEYQINNRKFRKIDLPILMELEDRYKSRLARENRNKSISEGKGDPNNLKVRFK